MCDLERFEKFNTFINAFTVTMPISKFFLYFLESIKNVVVCQISSIFVFRSDLIEN
jgi:ABC-type multidrug transport system permease subunit